mgnify:CR=1 FL=1|jgi:hypothetical protein
MAFEGAFQYLKAGEWILIAGPTPLLDGGGVNEN